MINDLTIHFDPLYKRLAARLTAFFIVVLVTFHDIGYFSVNVLVIFWLMRVIIYQSGKEIMNSLMKNCMKCIKLK